MKKVYSLFLTLVASSTLTLTGCSKDFGDFLHDPVKAKEVQDAIQSKIGADKKIFESISLNSDGTFSFSCPEGASLKIAQYHYELNKKSYRWEGPKSMEVRYAGNASSANLSYDYKAKLMAQSSWDLQSIDFTIIPSIVKAAKDRAGEEKQDEIKIKYVSVKPEGITVSLSSKQTSYIFYKAKTDGTFISYK